MRRRTIRALVRSVLSAAVLFALVTPAHAQHNYYGTLTAGQSLAPGDWLYSPSSTYGLQLIRNPGDYFDGALVYFNLNPWTNLWTDPGVPHPRTEGVATMQTDGNFVVYSSDCTLAYNSCWATGTDGHPGAYLKLWDSGQLGVYGPDHVLITCVFGGSCPDDPVPPTIQSLSVTSAWAGAGVAIYGSGFGAQPWSVQFNGTYARVDSWTDTTITVMVPCALAGPVRVTTASGLFVDGPTFTVVGPPSGNTITAGQSLCPNQSILSSNQTYGLYYSPQNGALAVYNRPTSTNVWYAPETLNTTPGFAVMQAAGNFVVYNPNASSAYWARPTSGWVQGSYLKLGDTGRLGVYDPNHHAVWCSTSPYCPDDLPPPAITDMIAAAAPGNTITITGSNFGSTQSQASWVRFNGTFAVVKGWTSSSISVIVPCGATSGNVVVTVDGVDSNGRSFTVGGAPSGNKLTAFTSLCPGQALWSPSHRYELYYSPDPSSGGNGSLTLFDNGPPLRNLWTASNTLNTTAGFAIMQSDGNFVVYGPTGWPDAHWGSGTSGYNGAHLSLLDTGNLFVFADDNETSPQWASGPMLRSLSPSSGGVGSTVEIVGMNFGTAPVASTVTINGIPAAVTQWSPTSIHVLVPCTTTGNVVVTINGVASNALTFTFNTPSPSGHLITTGQALCQNQSVVSDHGWYQLFYGSNGALVLFDLATTPATNLWTAPGTTGSSPGYARLNEDGTFVVYDGTGAQAWVAPSSQPAVVVDVQVDGNLVAYSDLAETHPVWATGTQHPLITSISPGSGTFGTPVTITGVGFQNAPGSVTFNGTPATPTSWTATTIVVPVPTGATTGRVVVTTPGLNGLSYQSHDTNVFLLQPRITSISPLGGPVDASVTITGNSFGATQGSSCVKFNGTTAPVTSWSSTSITVKVPAGATTGLVTVTVNGVDSNSVTFVVTSARLTSLSPSSGRVGDVVTISGLSLGDSNHPGTVKFNGTTATVTSWSSMSIVTTVPSGATTGEVVATVAGTPTNGLKFTVAPTITSLSPASGPIGTCVTINGANFGAAQGASAVTFNGIATTPASWSTTSIVVCVPNGTTTGSVVVTVGGIATNGNFSFTVAPATVGVTPSPVAPNGTITVSWSGVVSPSANDWFAVSPVGAPDDQWADWWYTAGVSSGSQTHVLPATMAAGTYEVRMFAADGWSRMGTSSPFTVQQQTVTVSPTSTGPGGTITVTWSGIIAPTSTDFFKLVATGAPDNQANDTWNTTGAASGVQTRALPATLPVGTYEVRLFSGSGTNPRLGVSNTFTVQSPVVNVTPTVVNKGGTLTVNWSGVQTPTSTDWFVLVPSGAADNQWVSWWYTNGAGAGTQTRVVPTFPSLAAGTYQVRLFAHDTWTRLAVSNTFTVQAPPVNSQQRRSMDYDGDGKSEIIVYRPSDGTWQRLMSMGGYVPGNTGVLGTATDIPVPGDYDGDGRMDLAVYRPSTGTWIIAYSQTSYGTGAQFQWGTATDIPVPGDYDADGKTDLAVYRPSNGTWQILYSSSNYTTSASFTLGSATNLTDLPVPGDYDGDGKTDLAVYRRSTSQWQILLSSTNTQTTTSWGSNVDVPVPGDYDADGKTDIAVYHRATGEWRILRSSTNTGLNIPIPTGSTPADIPVLGDYDADGKNDVAMFQRSTGTWRIVLSATNTTMTVVWGTSTDIPLLSIRGSIGGTDPSRSGDFDGDGKRDLVLFRPSTSDWRVEYSKGGYATNNVTNWGQSTDKLVPGDYDGDGVTDWAVFRPSEGKWYLRYANGTSTSILWGLSTDIPVPGDYDGDGKTDLAVFRPSDGTWRVTYARLGFTTSQSWTWGTATDVPVPGDYDGDGMTDPAFYRPSTGEWRVLTSSSGYSTSAPLIRAWGGDLPVPADFDGDGKTDMAFYRPTTGKWYVLRSQSNFTSAVTYMLGNSTDVPVPGDYDGDGLADPAVYRPSTNQWLILQSSTNYANTATYTWGAAGDVPAQVTAPASATMTPTVSSLSPAAGWIGQAITITGTNLTAAQGSSTVTFNGVAATTITSWSNTSITARVPLGATTGPVAVNVNGLASNSQTFTVQLSYQRLTDFDGDRKSDVTLYRPSNGTWYTATSQSGYSTTTGTITTAWGTSTDIPVPGDYDGDGKVDPAYFRPSTGEWKILKSSTNFTTNITIVCGVNGDLPVPGDYDGDGKTDAAIFHPATGQWQIVNSSTGATTTTAWGMWNDVPVPGDYDGDGKTDLAVFHLPTAQWQILKSSTGTATFTVWGTLLDIPVPGDYDGDGTTDIAVYHPTASGQAQWQIVYSSTGATINVLWGGATDIPIVGDFDGDGRSDLTTYRPSTGIWYVLKSTGNFGTSQVWITWGNSTDLPQPNIIVTNARSRPRASDITRAADVDRDGRSDVTLYRPTTGTWSTFTSLSGFTTSTTRVLGSGADLTVPGDYDGDGKADVAVFHPASGQWQIVNSSTGSTTTVTLGSWFDVPAPGDYDGDGKTDVAVFRPATGQWFIRNSSTGSTVTIVPTWAGSSPVDIPVPADYDGDGKTDVAVYRPTTGQSQWLILNSSTGAVTTTPYGTSASNEIPVPGDYDGDGKADIAVFRPYDPTYGTQMWWIKTATTQINRPWGAVGDVPMQGDYDGDGKLDFAVFRPGDGKVYVLESHTNFATQWNVLAGASGDRPVSNAIVANTAIVKTRPLPSNVTRATDFDRDARSDLTVYRPSNGTWYTLTSLSNYVTQTTTVLGSGNDLTVPGDYDGDGKADVAVFHPAIGQWQITYSSTGATTTVALGMWTDIPVPADFDGDGKTDVAVFHPATGQWQIRYSSTGALVTTTTSWVTSRLDVPVPADYDGDGKADIAVYQPGTPSVWQVLNSSTGTVTTTAYGSAGSNDIPVPGDYDGDGKADIAVFRPWDATQQTTLWCIKTATTQIFRAWGALGDVPVPADYDGDGKIDYAVFRPSNTTWYVLESHANYTTQWNVALGAATDRPIPNSIVANASIVHARPRPNDLTRATDFDRDGRSDIMVYRPVNGTWYVRSSLSSFATETTIPWGTATDIPVPGDYDGDGFTDAAFFRPSTGEWWIKQSSTGTSVTLVCGVAGDLPVPGDYDGDSRTDVAVFHPATAQWQIVYSSTGVKTTTAWSATLSTDVPVPGDYDGDGKTDLAIYRPSTFHWVILNSSTGTTTDVAWGAANDIPVQADYDGDGRTDLAVFRPGVFSWFVKTSSSNYASQLSYVWKDSATDIPEPGDYDGDGKADLALFRPTTRQWLIAQSSSSYVSGPTVVFSTATDVEPVRATRVIRATVASLGTTSGSAGQSVTITGTGFGATQGMSTVTFNGIAAKVTSWSNTSIIVTAPAGATTGAVVVTVNSLASNGQTFTYPNSVPTSITYYHTDAVGSVRMTTDQNGQVTARYDYLPFGEQWPPSAGTDPRMFAGKERDSTGFDYFGARYYSSSSARFTVADPIMDIEDSLVDPQRWNRYPYVRNNPLRFADPDGRCTDSAQGGDDACKAAQGAAISAGTQATQDAAVRANYVDAVSALSPTDTAGRRAVKIQAREVSSPAGAEIAEAIAPIAGEAARAAGNASKTNAAVNGAMDVAGKVGPVLMVAGAAVSVYNVATSPQPARTAAQEGGAWAGALAVGSQAGGFLAAFGGAVGGPPGAIIGGAVGVLGGGAVGAIGGSRIATRVYDWWNR